MASSAGIKRQASPPRESNVTFICLPLELMIPSWAGWNREPAVNIWICITVVVHWTLVVSWPCWTNHTNCVCVFTPQLLYLHLTTIRLIAHLCVYRWPTIASHALSTELKFLKKERNRSRPYVRSAMPITSPQLCVGKMSDMQQLVQKCKNSFIAYLCMDSWGISKSIILMPVREATVGPIVEPHP